MRETQAQTSKQTTKGAAKSPAKPAGSPGTDPLAPCTAPIRKVWPAQFVSFQREITSTDDAEDKLDLDLTNWATEADLKASILASFLQQWSLKEVVIGDHAATISLAPGEIHTIEVRNTRHTLLEESRETASTVEVGSEQTAVDKEALTVANTSSRASNWSISGSGGFSMSGIGASASATQAGTISDSVASTVNEVHDTTLRSSRKVATQTKIQIRGVTETTVETRQTRNLRNPFLDRSLMLNLYEINKRFEVQTSRDLLRPMITAHLHPFDFKTDKEMAKLFIASNVPFLQEALLDPELAAALPAIVSAAREMTAKTQRRAEAEARLNKALEAVEDYLFENRPGWQPYHHSNTDEDIIFGEKNGKAIGAFADASTGTAAADAAAVGPDAMQLFLVLHAAHTLRQASLSQESDVFERERQTLLASLATEVSRLWSSSSLNDGNRWSLLDRNEKTELFRRVPGFLFLYKSLVEHAAVPAGEEGEVASLTDALLEHIARYAPYYTEQYVRFLWGKLGRSFVVRLTNTLLYTIFTGQTPGEHDVDSCRPFRNLYRVEDVQRDGLCVLVPLQSEAVASLKQSTSPTGKKFGEALTKLAAELEKSLAPKPRVDEVIVPAEGVHIEPVAGSCVLPLPPRPNGDGKDGAHGGGDQA